MTAPSNDPTTSIKIEDVVAELDELGRAKWETALARVEAKQLRAELARVINDQQAQTSPSQPDEFVDPRVAQQARDAEVRNLREDVG